MTDKAILAMNDLFVQALRANSIPGNDGACVVEQIKLADAYQEEDGGPVKHHVVVLTLSSYLFRIVTLFDFCRDAATEAHLAVLARAGDKVMTEQSLLDAFAELVNMICGNVNRALCIPFRHVGMSTPFPLESSSARYISILQPTTTLQYRVEINGEVRFKVLVCICTDSETSLDFAVPVLDSDNVGSGEIELF